ncbi:hypothetical protein INR49_020858, partial [Caranx melampygus]
RKTKWGKDINMEAEEQNEMKRKKCCPGDRRDLSDEETCERRSRDLTAVFTEHRRTCLHTVCLRNV